MDRSAGPGIDIKRDPQPLKRIFDHGMVLIYHILRGDPCVARLQGNGHPMLIGPPDEKHLFSFQPEITGIYVGGNVNPGQVADMDRPVGIRKGRRDQRALEISHGWSFFVRGTKITHFSTDW